MLISRIGVAVMTGGQSSRMGTDKAGLMFNARETFLQKICGRMSFFPERYLSVNAERCYEVQDFVPVVDEISGAGPAGGILSVLRRSEAEAVLFLACDMPCFTRDEAYRLISIYSGEDVLIPAVSGRWQPLASLYSKRVLPFFEESINSGEFRLRDIIRKTAYREVPVPPEYTFNYLNVNTPEEYRSLINNPHNRQ
ncbi:MAG: molybdenum cofactor guanylyltransferase [Ruminobacter sp.]|nr:molybdenum cofactor guanylyltransferase [Ruminobacter sp.]